MRCAIVIEQAENNFSAYVSDLPGCVSTGKTISEVENEIRDAIIFHVKGLREDRLPASLGLSHAQYVEAA